MPKIVILNAKKDADVLELFVKHLRPSQITCWSRNNITPGENRSESVKNAIEASEVVVLLLTSNFTECLGKQSGILSLALDHSKQYNKHLIPVLLNFCDAKNLPALQGLEFLPRDGHPVIHDGVENIERLRVVVAEIVTETKNKENLDLLLNKYFTLYSS